MSCWHGIDHRAESVGNPRAISGVEWCADDGRERRFYGTLDGWFKAADARGGEVLWSFQVGSGIIGNDYVSGARWQAVRGRVLGDRWRHGAADRRRRCGDTVADVRERGDARPRSAYSQGGTLYVFALRPAPVSVAGTTAAAWIVLALGVAACGGERCRSTHGSSGIRFHDFIAHRDYVRPGLPAQRELVTLRNPLARDKQAAAAGKSLFVNYNCADCHGADGSGAMGPSLQDGRWHYGGSDGELFQSIYEGRPTGMPAWGGRISDDQIWLLVSYVQSLSAGHDATTEDFGGETQERTGH